MLHLCVVLKQVHYRLPLNSYIDLELLSILFTCNGDFKYTVGEDATTSTHLGHIPYTNAADEVIRMTPSVVCL